MWLFVLLLAPVLVILVGLILGKGKVTLKEFAVELALMIVLIVAGYFISRYQSVSDTEIWNGWIQQAEYYEEWWERVSCRHPIYCTRSCGKNCTERYVCGHEHAYDVDYHPPQWDVTTSNNESTSINAARFETIAQAFKNKEYVHITRFSKHRGPGNKYVTNYVTGVSEFMPTAVEHSFINYIKADPYTILKRVGQGEKFKNLLPGYPRARDLTANCVLVVGGKLNSADQWNKGLAAVNGRLGARKQVNIIIVVVNTNDSAYVHALEEHWLGGKKNDFVIIIGSTSYPKIDWVRTMSWSRSEDLKVELRDSIQGIGDLEKRPEILSLVETAVGKKFVRTPMADFEYLMAGWQPSIGVLILLFVLGIGGSVGLTIYFTKEDPFRARLPRYY